MRIKKCGSTSRHIPDKNDGKEVIHSGHFMVSNFEADAEDDEENVLLEVPDGDERNEITDNDKKDQNIKEHSTVKESGKKIGGLKRDYNGGVKTNFMASTSAIVPTNKSSTSRYSQLLRNDSGHIPIDSSLTKLFNAMSLVYRQKITSPKWNPFKGLKLRWKDKIRLNNVIWRCWHMQFIMKKKMRVCQFTLDVDMHNKPEAIILEGKYWKRQLNAVTAEYKKWRIYYRNRITGQEAKPDSDMCAIDLDDIDWRKGISDMQSLGDEDIDFFDFTNMLFPSLISVPQTFAFPNPREIARGTGNSDLYQPGLIQLQPNIDDFMEFEQPLKDLLTNNRLSSLPEDDIFSSIETPTLDTPAPPDIPPTPQYPSPTPQYPSPQCSSYQSLPSNASSPQDSPSPTVHYPTEMITQSFQDMFSPSPPVMIRDNARTYATTTYANSPTVYTEPIMPISPQSHHQIIQPVNPSVISPVHMPVNQTQPLQLDSRKKKAISYEHLPDIPHKSGRTSTHANSLLAQELSPYGAEMKPNVIQPVSSIPVLLANSPVLSNQHSVQTVKPRPIQRDVKCVRDVPYDQVSAGQNFAKPAKSARKVIQPSAGNVYSQSYNHGKTSYPPIAPAPLPSPSVITTNQTTSYPTTQSYVTRVITPVIYDDPNMKYSPVPSTSSGTVKYSLLFPDVNTNKTNPVVSNTVLQTTPNSLTNSGMSTFTLSAVTPSSIKSIPISKLENSSWSGSFKSSPMEFESISDKSSAAGSSSNKMPFRPKTDVEKEQHKELRRVCHITAEKKRRTNIKNNFELLHSLIPASLKEKSNTKVSKAMMLNKGAEYIQTLKREREELAEVASSYKQQIQSLNLEISEYQSQLPATGAPISHNNQNKLQQMFDSYVKERTMDDWRFWVFSLIAEPLLQSFNTNVSTSSTEDLCRTSLGWIDQHCTLNTLRPLASQALREVSTNTDILNDPSKLPHDVYLQFIKKEQHSHSSSYNSQPR